MTRGIASGRELTSDMLDDNFRLRYWKKVRKTKGCWFWTGARNSNGFGGIQISPVYGLVLATRAGWVIANGTLEAGLVVKPTCKNKPGCVRPEHLELSTPALVLQEAARPRKLHWDGVNEVRTNAAKVGYAALADTLDFTPTTIASAAKNRTYFDPDYTPARPWMKTKLTWDQVEEAKAQWKGKGRRGRQSAPGPTLTELAERYGVAYSTVWYAVNGVTRDRSTRKQIPVT